VTTVEIKSGYGLDCEHELKCLRVARGLGGDRVRIVTTLLGAHALPPEFAGRADDYVDEICREMIPAAAKENLADAVDAFCEGIGFSPAQTRRVFECARAHGLRVKLHADQLSNLDGAALAAEFGALSADHLEHTDERGIEAMARAGHGGGSPARRVLFPARDAASTDRRASPPRRPRSRSPPIAIPALRRSPRPARFSTWRARSSASRPRRRSPE
jgi:imidazolonepropionase